VSPYEFPGTPGPRDESSRKHNVPVSGNLTVKKKILDSYLCGAENTQFSEGKREMFLILPNMNLFTQR